jgi:hypothetical protein
MRVKAAECVAQICQGNAAELEGARILSLLILFEAWLVKGGDATAELMGWDVVPREPVKLADVKAQMAKGEWP